MRKTLLVTSAVAAGLVGVFAGPASAGTTSTTFTVTGNASGLTISTPAPASAIATAAAGATSASGQLGNITVTDPRGLLVDNWIATVSSTDFITGGATTDETVPKGSITYSSGVGTAAVGQVGAMVSSVGVSLGASATAARWAGTGNSTVTWNPTLNFALIPSQVAGTYSGTITHSVA